MEVLRVKLRGKYVWELKKSNKTKNNNFTSNFDNFPKPKYFIKGVFRKIFKYKHKNDKKINLYTELMENSRVDIKVKYFWELKRAN